MENSSSEKSISQRCPCGFWGTSETQGLCSLCFKQQVGQTNGNDSQQAARGRLPTIPIATPDLKNEQYTSSKDKLENKTRKRLSDSENIADNAVISDEDVKIDQGEAQLNSTAVAITSDKQTSPPDAKVQKSKKRCYLCNCKLEPAIREIGRCRCQFIFCQLHRLAEQHSCTYDHKENGRNEAREKMVPAVRYLGNNVKRI